VRTGNGSAMDGWSAIHVARTNEISLKMHKILYFYHFLDRNTQWSVPRLALTQLAVILEWFRPGFVAKSRFYFLIMMGFATFLPKNFLES
jgi:hypothetical protein